MLAAVAIGAGSAHYADPQGIDGRPEHDAVALDYTGMGGNAPALDVLPLPEITRDAFAEDIASLGKAQRIIDQRAEKAAAKVAAERKAAERQVAQADRRAQLVPGGVIAPTTGVITSSFGPRWGTTHYGLDIANDIGTPVFSVMDGTVVESGPASGFGLWVRIRHDDGTITVYGHINTTLVAQGQRVTAGEQIATVGNRGQSTGPHLHFEVHLGGERKTDPRAWLVLNGVQIGRTIR
ncbi:MAG: M23 family metallopeptidase [Pseudonocardiaceae bacterium]